MFRWWEAAQSPGAVTAMQGKPIHTQQQKRGTALLERVYNIRRSGRFATCLWWPHFCTHRH